MEGSSYYRYCSFHFNSSVYAIFRVVHKEPTPVAPDYKESDPNISTEVTKEEPRDETIYWYYKNNIPAIDVSQIETTTVHSIYNQGYDVQYLGYMTDRYWGDMLYPDDSTHPLNIDAVPDDKVYLMDSLVEQYNSTQRIYEKFDGEISYPQVTEAQDYNFCCALAINDKDTLVAADSILFEFYNEALQGIESIQAYGDSGLVITVYGDVSDSEIQSGVETVINSYTNEETFYLGDTDVFDKTVEQFSYLGDKVKISYTSKDKKSTDNEAPADTKVTKLISLEFMMYLRVYIKWQHLIIGIDIVGHQVVAWCPQVFRKVLRLKNMNF